MKWVERTDASRYLGLFRRGDPATKRLKKSNMSDSIRSRYDTVSWLIVIV